MSPAENYASKSPGIPIGDTCRHLIKMHLGFIGSFLEKVLLFLYDLYSRWMKLYYPVSNITSKETISSFRHSFVTYALHHVVATEPPLQVISSNPFVK